MERKPIGPDAYDEEWMAAAWGEKANRRLLEEGLIRPRPRIGRALALAGFRAGDRVLDIACGRGEIPAIARRAGATAVGLDYSSAALAFATQLKLAQLRSGTSGGSLEFIQGDASQLPFADNSFDRITLLDIIEHLTPDQLGDMFREVRRVLKPGGFAVLHTLPNRWVYDVTYRFLHRVFGWGPPEPRGEIERKIHVNEQDVVSLNRKLWASGLQHRIWLEQLMPAQARWSRGENDFGDNRDLFYPSLAGFLGRVLEWLSRTPLKLFLCNDIYGVVWKATPPTSARMPLAFTERLVCRLAG